MIALGFIGTMAAAATPSVAHGLPRALLPRTRERLRGGCRTVTIERDDGSFRRSDAATDDAADAVV
jgi:hypothetical protein